MISFVMASIFTANVGAVTGAFFVATIRFAGSLITTGERDFVLSGCISGVRDAVGNGPKLDALMKTQWGRNGDRATNGNGN